MSHHLEVFARQNIVGKPRGYLIALGIVCSQVHKKGRLSDKIKDVLASKGTDILKINVKRRSAKYHSFLQSRAINTVSVDRFERSLQALRVKDFRGFGSFSTDDRGLYVEFNPGKNIFYAPNGGGKTSLCEAIEYVFTGRLKEADRRRTRTSDYISRGGQKPIVRIKLDDDSEFKGIANLSSCFIDKNRLQEFSLLGSKDTNSNEKDVLAALFGLEEIENLISRFVLPRSFQLSSIKINVAHEKRRNLDNEFALLLDQKSAALRDIESSREAIINALGITSYDRALVENRFAFKKRLHAFKVERLMMQRLTDAPEVPDIRRILIFLKQWARHAKRYCSAKMDLLQGVEETSFEKLYAAVLSHEENAADHCPACLTPLSEVHENPYARAKDEIQKLEKIIALRKDLFARKELLIKFHGQCLEYGGKIAANASRGIVVHDCVKRLLDEIAAMSVDDSAERTAKSIELIFESCLSNRDSIQEYADRCYQVSAERSNKSLAYSAKERTIEGLKSEIEEIQFHFRHMKTQRKQIESIGPKIKSYGERCRALERQLAEEDSFNQLLSEIEGQYKVLCDDLNSYKISEEESQVAGIERRAVELYQNINDGDDDSERVASLSFQREDNGYRICIKTETGELRDAFSCLSEGHLRALGLSLLLAVASKNKFPFIVFDDVVNAIDSDHRANIVRLLFEDSYLRKVQQIITTHDRLFWERYSNAARSKFGKENFSGRVLTCTNKGILVESYEAGFKRKIEDALKLYDIRQALLYCRIWFETLVANYCTEKQLSVTAAFNRRQLKPNNYLEISLESTYDRISELMSWDLSNIDIIRNDLINWKGQNQEHHAFDEKNFNFVHSKTSDEVKKIFDAIVRFEYQLFPAELLSHLQAEQEDILLKLHNVDRQLENPNFIEKAPATTVERYRTRRLELEGMLAVVNVDLTYLQRCIEETSRLVATVPEGAGA
jgi:DNA sulfur modification protein DndD